MSNSSLPRPDHRFGTLKRVLETSTGAHPSRGSLEESRIQAAVSLILRQGPELEALLIRRAEAEGDPWSGHMALPGGRWQQGDGDLRATAMRETEEETAVQLADGALHLGHLPPLSPSTFRLPPLSIHPFVFGVAPGTEATVASPEVDEVLWTPLSRLHGPEAEGTVEIPLGDVRRTFPCLRVGERVIWGLTYRILRGFLQRIREASPELLTCDVLPFPG